MLGQNPVRHTGKGLACLASCLSLSGQDLDHRLEKAWSLSGGFKQLPPAVQPAARDRCDTGEAPKASLKADWAAQRPCPLAQGTLVSSSSRPSASCLQEVKRPRAKHDYGNHLCRRLTRHSSRRSCLTKTNWVPGSSSLQRSGFIFCKITENKRNFALLLTKRQIPKQKALYRWNTVEIYIPVGL